MESSTTPKKKKRKIILFSLLGIISAATVAISVSLYLFRIDDSKPLKSGSINNFENVQFLGLSGAKDVQVEIQTKMMMRGSGVPSHRNDWIASSTPVTLCSIVDNAVLTNTLLDENSKVLTDYCVKEYKENKNYIGMTLAKTTLRQANSYECRFELSDYSVQPLFDMSDVGLYYDSDDVLLTNNGEGVYTPGYRYLISKNTGKVYNVDEFDGLRLLGYNTHSWFEGDPVVVTCENIETKETALYSVDLNGDSFELRQIISADAYKNFLTLYGEPIVDRYGNLFAQGHALVNGHLINDGSLFFDNLSNSIIKFDDDMDLGHVRFYTPRNAQYLDSNGEFVPLGNDQYVFAGVWGPRNNNVVYSHGEWLLVKDPNGDGYYKIEFTNPSSTGFREYTSTKIDKWFDYFQNNKGYRKEEDKIYEFDLDTLEEIEFDCSILNISDWYLDSVGNIVIEGITDDLRSATGYIIDNTFTYDVSDPISFDNNKTYHLSPLK